MKAIAYYRVSTEGQGRSGLGLDAQRSAVEGLCAGRGWELVAPAFTEVESGKRNDRRELLKALHRAKVTGATLVVAKLDRLSRNLAFLATLQESRVMFIAADMPEANELTIHIMAAMAQHERKANSRRTREALQVAKARGVKLGNPNGAAALRRANQGNAAAIQALRADADARAADLRPVIDDMRERGIVSLNAIAGALNEGGFVTARSGRWHATTVRNLLARLSVVRQ
ncbi:recombinase family protein [Novosphingobium piscinae]|uniref:Recombinase family protein n=1 Tax=Novosphingobium piscinae TaxID=1507448 RepID=A0A7X1FZ74_9SPHN|nr:recombinase family protein [Novosphingobium piscinae]MBC2669709.1 recombinase family protein [Novosphingobium piscinae]